MVPPSKDDGPVGHFSRDSKIPRWVHPRTRLRFDPFADLVFGYVFVANLTVVKFGYPVVWLPGQSDAEIGPGESGRWNQSQFRELLLIAPIFTLEDRFGNGLSVCDEFSFSL